MKDILCKCYFVTFFGNLLPFLVILLLFLVFCYFFFGNQLICYFSVGECRAMYILQITSFFFFFFSKKIPPGFEPTVHLFVPLLSNICATAPEYILQVLVNMYKSNIFQCVEKRVNDGFEQNRMKVDREKLPTDFLVYT